MVSAPYHFTTAIAKAAAQPTRLVYRFWSDGSAEWISISESGQKKVAVAQATSPWDTIRSLEQMCRADPTAVCSGYLAYELGEHEILGQTKKTLSLPLVHLNYTSPNVTINDLNDFFGWPGEPLSRPAATNPLSGADGGSQRFHRTGPEKMTTSSFPRQAIIQIPPQQDRPTYEHAVQSIQAYLRAGDCYQVNYTQAFHTQTNQSAPQLFDRLIASNPAPYAAFMECGDFSILSSSPECFLLMEDTDVLTIPIKGTIARGTTSQDDDRLKHTLLHSQKDNAELLMICDLERNDLGQVCVPGSVKVESLPEIQTLPTLHHLISRIRGTLRPDTLHTDALHACFPGGSITGAPKKRAMEIIASLEPHARGVYTGCMGYMGHITDSAGNTSFRSEWNIAIRTLIYQDGLVVFHSGGGITIDSNPRAEYEESLLKAKALWQALS